MISKPMKHLMLVTSIFIEPNYIRNSPSGEAKFQPVKKFPDFYGNQSFITAFKKAHNSYCIITYRRQFTENFMRLVQTTVLKRKHINDKNPNRCNNNGLLIIPISSTCFR